MANNVYLSVGDGATSDYLSLNSGDYRIQRPVGIIVPPYDPNATARLITVNLTIQASSADNMLADIRALLLKQRQAEAASGPFPQGTGVTLGIQQSTSTMVLWDVLTIGIDGLPTGMPRSGNASTQWEIGLLAGTIQGVVLTLVCLPVARSSAVTNAVSATLTSGLSCVLYQPSIPGDIDPITRVTVKDVSTASQVVNRIRIGRRALPTMASGDFSPILDLTATSPGAATTDATSYTGANFARVTASTSWQTIAYATKPAAQYTSGLFDTYLRLRDSTSVLAAPSMTTPTPTKPTVRQVVSAAATSATSVSATWGSTTRTNNFVALQATWSVSTTITPPGGWTVIHQDNSSVAPGQAVYYLAGALPQSGAVTVNFSGAVNSTIRLIEIENVSIASIVGSNSGTPSGANGATINASVAVSTTDTYQSVLGFWGGDGNATGYTMANGNAIIDSKLAGTANCSCATLRDLTSSTGGVAASTTVTVSAGTANYSGCTVLIDSGDLARSTTYNTAVIGVTAGGALSKPSTPLAVSTTTYKSFQATVSGGSFDHYRWYVQPAGGSYYSQDMDAGETTAWIKGQYGGAVTLATTTPTVGQFRARVGLSSGTVMRQSTYIASPVLATSNWELIYLGTLTLPPAAAAEGGALPSWRLEVQGMHATGTPTLDVDCVYLFPAMEPQLHAHYRDSAGTDMNLATSRTWTYDQRRDYGRASVILYDGSSNEVGQATFGGDFRLGVGDNLILCAVDVASGVNDVTNAKVTIQVTYEPRFLYVAGLVT